MHAVISKVSSHTGAARRFALWLLAPLMQACAGPAGQADVALSRTGETDCSEATFGVVHVDTLLAPVGYPLVAPRGAAYVDSALLVYDHSERAVISYLSNRRGKIVIHGVQRGEPRLLAGAAFLFRAADLTAFSFSDGVAYRYSHTGEHLATDSSTREMGRVWQRMRVLDDSLVLISNSMVGNTDGGLLELRGLDLALNSEFHHRRNLRARVHPYVSGMMSVHADGNDGTVFAAMTGDDSVFQYSQYGELLAAGVLTDGQTTVASFDSLFTIEQSRTGSAAKSFLKARPWAVSTLIAIDRRTAIVQLHRTLRSDQLRRDLNAPSLLVLVSVYANEIGSASVLEIDGTLVARAPADQRAVVLLRSTNESPLLLERLMIPILDTIGGTTCDE